MGNRHETNPSGALSMLDNVTHGSGGSTPKALTARTGRLFIHQQFIAGPEPYGPSVGFAEDWSSDCRILIDSSSHAR